MRRALLVLIACIAAALLALPAYAANGDYVIDELSTEITVETDATTHIVEQQVLTFSSDNTGVVWYLHVPESGESVRISNVRVAPVDNGGTLLEDWTRLQMVDSNPRRQGASPGDSAVSMLRTPKTQPWYSYSISDGMMRCWFPLSTPFDNATTSDSSSASEGERYQTFIIETDYTIRNRVRVYRDVAELYWRYVNDSLPSDSRDVNLIVKLPVPEGMEPSAVIESVRAWGHGPDEGTFTVDGDGTVTYLIEHIDRGKYAEAHIIFPASWMTDMAANAANFFSSVRGPQAIEEEAEWVDLAKREIAWDNNVRVLFLGIAVVIILVGVVSVLRNGRSPKSRRALLRVSATLAIVGLAEHLFFHEPLTTSALMALAAIVALITLMLPQKDEEATEDDLHEEA